MHKKKTLTIFLTIIALLFAFTLIYYRSNVSYREELQIFIDMEVQEEDKYTPNSYQSYLTSLEQASKIKNNIFASKDKLISAKKDLQRKIESLIIKPDKSVLISLLEETKNVKEDIYTTSSYSQLEKTITSANYIVKDSETTQINVDNMITQLQNNLNNLEIATQGVYEIGLSFSMLSNNHVGNEWSKSVKYNGDTISNGDTITEKLGTNITLNITITERDKVPDSSSGTIDIQLYDGSEASTQITVKENRGRYSGNKAKWEIKCSIELIERIP